MTKWKVFFAGVFATLGTALAYFVLGSRRQKPMDIRAQEAVDKLDEIQNREAIDEKFLSMSDTDIILHYIREADRRKREDTKPK